MNVRDDVEPEQQSELERRLVAHLAMAAAPVQPSATLWQRVRVRTTRRQASPAIRWLR